MKITGLDVAAYKFPTPEPEADGTLQWDATTAVVVQVHAGDVTGLGWTYGSPATPAIVQHHLVGQVVGKDADDITACYEGMRRTCRNLGSKGLVMQAISAVDVALWDLKARLHSMSLPALLGSVRDAVPVYGSGGFTTMTDDQLAEQIAGWREIGCTAMKIKIGESRGGNVARDLERVRQLREQSGDGVEIMVDANGGYSRGQALRVGAALDELGVVWFEEPVSSDDVDGLGVLRGALRCDVTAGEYASDVYEIEGLCGVLDCIQLDATRCGGYTGFLRGAAIAAAHNLEVSAHCAPALHAPVTAATANLRHIEFFADHARLEPQLFDGVPVVRDGLIRANTSPGHGLALSSDADRWKTG
ncbi:MAG TPA: enolase C-terminal domain-like protein [Jatrophihabitantaceae bacterium]|nr:enolase C-terminal domain-like protein [Jatrophihabitantaceae bacterium]